MSDFDSIGHTGTWELALGRGHLQNWRSGGLVLFDCTIYTARGLSLADRLNMASYIQVN